jgi:hypothetical protein
MGKAGPSGKSGQKSARKPAAARKPASKAKRPARGAGPAPARKANGVSNGAPKAAVATRKSAAAAPRQPAVVQAEVMVPETPPPLPAPIASFTF